MLKFPLSTEYLILIHLKKQTYEWTADETIVHSRNWRLEIFLISLFLCKNYEFLISLIQNFIIFFFAFCVFQKCF